MLRGEGVTRSFGGLTAVAGADFHVERAEEVGGNLFIDSSPGQGTRVLADLPLVNVQ